MTATLEHVNITVRDPEATARILSRIFGWSVRWQGGAKAGGSTVHIGDERSYLAIYVLDPNAPGAPPPEAIAGGLNHVGVLVDDLDAVERRVVAEGLVPHNHDDYEPGRRFYFNDHDDIEYEVVSYS